MAVPNLKLTDVDNNVYNFPPDFWISDDPFDTNSNISNKFYAAGGRNIADGYLQARTISIGGQIRGDTITQYESRYRDFMQAVLKGGQLEKTVDAVSRYIEVYFPSVSTGQEENQRFKEVTVDFIAEDPFWKDSTQTIDTQVLAGNGTFYVDNTGSDFLVSPIIEVEANQAANLPSVKMINKSDGGMEFQFNYPNFQIGDVLVINCEEGTVKVNNGNRIEYFDPGRFFRLQPWNNEIEYEGNACTINFKFRKIYL